ncbi:unnamed protein product [Phaedon cochleariae]|uniref:Uncharacterized protein n=1 Tax=Phaedon cochleariae TaxID=80249 RepID=A0A9N9X3G4_PHACE|nr:unnamed protein product [Phaedon cochleariae]
MPLYGLYLLPDRPECLLPPLGVECILHGVQPSMKLNPKGLWTEQVNEHWKNQTYNVLLFGQVHSVVDNVVYLVVYKSDPGRKQIKSLNQMMLDLGHAEPAVESFLSKEDHAKREKLGSNCKTIELKGPYSPLEMRLYGCIESSADKSVEIEGNSINTVLLDSEPQDYHTSQSATGSRIKLRQTTLMPNVPGLPMLLTLIFCPTMRPKVTEDVTRVASLLCGLGFNPYTDKPFYPAHDLINRIRFYMNQGMKLMYELTQEVLNQEELVRTQKALKKDLVEMNVKYANVWSKNMVDTVTLKPNVSEESEDIWPLLWYVPTIESQCHLCQTLFVTVHEVRRHLITKEHKQNVSDYYEQLQELNRCEDPVD